jgi:hypothetical protein
VSGARREERRATDDKRRTTSDERRTTNDERRTTNDERRTTLAATTRGDTVTLFHLLRRTHDPRALDRLEAVVPLPTGTSRAAILAGAPEAMTAYREALERTWL